MGGRLAQCHVEEAAKKRHPETGQSAKLLSDEDKLSFIFLFLGLNFWLLVVLYSSIKQAFRILRPQTVSKC